MKWFGTSAKNEDRLDADLDLLVKGRKPEGPLGDTVEQVFHLACKGELLSSRMTMAVMSRKPEKRVPLAFPFKTDWRIAMFLTSTAAVVAIVLSMTFGGIPTAFWSNIGNDDSRPQIAAQVSTPTCEEIRQDTGLEGNCTSTPPPPPDNSGIMMAEAPRALTADDCTVEPRSREEMLDVLSTLPEARTHPILSIDTESELPTLDNFFDGMEAGVALTQDAYDQAQAAFIEWQACTTFYLTWQWAALESDTRLREEVYVALNANGEGPYGYLNATEPYSEATLNEILDGWEASEAVSRDHLAEGEFTATDRVFVFDPNSVYYSADGTIFSGAAREFVGGVDSASPDGGSGMGEVQLSVDMVLEDGVWRLAYQKSESGGLG